MIRRSRRASVRVWCLSLLAVGALAAAMLAPLSAPPALAAAGDQVVPPGSLAVTFVARTCGDYTDIMANRARNNIQESLRDLGKDTVYSAGQPVVPEIEEPNDPNCTPLRDWDFQMGTGYTGKTEATDYLSTVTGPYATPITTGGPIPELNAQGEDTGRTIDGAVTVVLSPEQARQAQQANSLWVQGGRVTEPLPASGEFGFGALRCAVDNLNGDNVEFVSYPTAARHVFCYYYAVSPPPAAGTITVVKELADGTPGSATFPFEGNISYDRDSEGDTGRFDLTASAAAPGSITFVRGAVTGAAPPWTFSELIPDGWELTTEPSCETQLGSPWVYDDGFSVSLTAGDAVVCTFVNNRELTGPAFLFKQTLGEVGTFPFTVRPPAPLDPITDTVEVIETETPTQVASTLGSIPGTYSATETLPVISYGTWELDSVICDDGDVVIDVPFTVSGQDRTATHDIGAGGSTTCLFTNAFASDGRIDITKASFGGTATFPYSIVPVGSDIDDQYRVAATTIAEGAPVVALPVDGSGPAVDLPIGSTWDVQEFLPAATDDGYWRVRSAECGAGLRGADPISATVRVEITQQNPEVSCSFVNEFVSAGSLEVRKATSAVETLRPTAAVLEWSCDDETSGRLDVPAGAADATTGAVTTTGYIECVVIESATGAAQEVGVATTATLDVNGTSAPYTLGEPFPVAPEDVAVVSVSNVLTAPTPTPTPTATPTQPPLPATGSDFDPRQSVFVALSVIVLGGLLLAGAWTVRRRREAQSR